MERTFLFMKLKLVILNERLFKKLNTVTLNENETFELQFFAGFLMDQS